MFQYGMNKKKQQLTQHSRRRKEKNHKQRVTCKEEREKKGKCNKFIQLTL